MNKKQKEKYERELTNILNSGYSQEIINDLINMIYEILGEC